MPTKRFRTVACAVALVALLAGCASADEGEVRNLGTEEAGSGSGSGSTSGSGSPSGSGT